MEGNCTGKNKWMDTSGSGNMLQLFLWGEKKKTTHKPIVFSVKNAAY